MTVRPSDVRGYEPLNQAVRELVESIDRALRNAAPIAPGQTIDVTLEDGDESLIRWAASYYHGLGWRTRFRRSYKFLQGRIYIFSLGMR